MTRTHRPHVAVLLAAGGSTRLGTPKQLLRRGGETLVHRVARLAAETSPERLLVVLGADHARIARALADIPHTPLVNADWRTGLASSLRAAASSVPIGRAVLILACDQPALELRRLDALLAGARTASSTCAATDFGEALGIPAVVPGTWFAQHATDGDHGFHAYLRAVPADEVFTLRAPELALDVDTPDDLRVAIDAGLLDPLG